MITKIIILLEAPFVERDYKRYGIDIIKENGFDVEVWNLAPLLNFNAFINIKLPNSVIANEIIYYHKKDIFIDALNKLEDQSFIYTTLSLNASTYSVFRAISKNNIPYCVTSLNAVPNFGKEYSASIVERLKNLTFKKIFFKILSNLPISFLGVKNASMVAVLGNKTNYNRPEIGKNTKIVFTQSFDYDQYLKANLINEKLPSGIVYLDNYLPYHTDSLYSGEKSPVDPETYHFSLNNLFDYLEAKTGKKIIVAAHPKAHYSFQNNPFNGREIIAGKTAELVKVSDLVVLNFSTSFNFAILYKKPVIFFTSNDLEKIKIYKIHIKGMADMFNQKALNIDQPYNIDETQIYSVDEKKYIEYKNSFIKIDGTQEAPVWQIMCDAIKTLK